MLEVSPAHLSGRPERAHGHETTEALARQTLRELATDIPPQEMFRAVRDAAPLVPPPASGLCWRTAPRPLPARGWAAWRTGANARCSGRLAG